MSVSKFNVYYYRNKFSTFILSKYSCMPKVFRKFILNKLCSFEQKKYDEIISLGANCVTAMTLRYCGIRYHSYPFDWIAKYEFFDRFKLIKNRFKDFFNFNDLKFEIRHGKYYATNGRTNYVMPHDFGKCSEGSPFDKYPEANLKYRRRVDRLYENTRNKKILLVYFEVDDERLVSAGGGIDDLDNYLSEIKDILKASSIDLLFLHGGDNFPYGLIKQFQGKDKRCSYYIASYNKENYNNKKWGLLYFELGLIIKAICMREEEKI